MKNAEATNTTETAAVAEQGAQVAPETVSYTHLDVYKRQPRNWPARIGL